MARIVYAEDDELIAEHVRETLSEAGYVVGIVNDGISALQAIKIKHPDLVILDAEMPGLPGPEVLRKMRTDPKLFDIPVLMLTARRSKGDEDLAKYAGANEYLRKPYDPDQLVAVVNSLVPDAPKRRAFG
ncbi:MAG: response regulator [Parasphingopyxis sp.]|uniref:response regulator transcription factor n=1 Tax=Parasphingopyxis sp. TaxID=1920299 RepID=UPI002614BCB6|nr:response regulator [uncultured Parasphingopyxis sp.]